eukprot:COSAG06_NODE_4116_length_4557_cov_6.756842_2_plen_79_part_00
MAKVAAEEAKAAKARAKVTNVVIKAVKLAAKDALQPLRAEEKRKLLLQRRPQARRHHRHHRPRRNAWLLATSCRGWSH